MAHRWHGKESRWGDRVNVNVPVQLWADTLAGADACMSNLSLSGALVKANVDLGLHSIIEVNIKMPTSSQRGRGDHGVCVPKGRAGRRYRMVRVRPGCC
jgi:hypothetical protein